MKKASKRRWNNPLTIAILVLSAVFIVLSTGLFKPKPTVSDGVVGQVIDIDLRGPDEIESHTVFSDYRVNLVITHDDGTSVTVPAYFAADGNAAETGAISGTVWRAHFVPPKAGRWSYRVDFKTGGDIAMNDGIGQSVRKFDGARGAFSVEALGADVTDKRLFDTQTRYLQNARGVPFLKTGAGSPENILAYVDFDGTYDVGGTHFPALGEAQLHRFDPHIKDAKTGDPIWRGGKGAAILGIANYYKDVGVNAQYLVTMNIEGDGQDVFPYVDHTDPYVFDVSKLAQWQRVLGHFNDQDVLIDMLLTETENESWFEAFDGVNVSKDFAPSRKLYYREMVARFSHLPMLVWNLGEENGVVGNSGQDPYRQPTTAAQRLAFASYIKALDPQDHAIQSHNWPDGEDDTYGPKLGADDFSGISLQAHHSYFEKVMTWTQKAQAAGRGWMVSVDEPLGWEYGARPDDIETDKRREIEGVLWPTLLAGGAGVDWYFGWQNNAPTSDLSNEDQRSRDALWKTSANVRGFFDDNFDMNSLRASMNSDGTQTQTTLTDKAGHAVVISMGRTKPTLPEGEGHIPWVYTIDSLTLSHQGEVTVIDPMAPNLRLHAD
ncbi:DUF5060 domain-containing protein [Fretibacter rubidus]|uniref:DUF5060 domain-containing protein n=1 Tax=Fretibacter rubidus TaxID=570162 RepID=UPI00352A5D88